MKAIRMLGRSIRDAFKSTIRNFSLSLASISCITITLVIVAIALIASFNVQNFTQDMERNLTIVAFIEKNTPEEELKIIEEEIKKLPNIESCVFESKKTIKEKTQQESETLNEILGSWEDEENPFRDTFQIRVSEIEKVKSTANKIKKIENVSIVRYGEGYVDKMVQAFSAVEKVTFGMVIALIIVTVFLIINTIKLTISARKREISIMRLVGASNFSIKTPFFIEGMFLGCLGSIIPILITTFGYLAFYKHCNGILFSEIIRLIKPEPFIYFVSLVVLIIGILVGTIGSASAVRKYLKV